MSSSPDQSEVVSPAQSPTQPPTQTVVHVDINAYFATLLQQEVPSLRGRPVGVLKDVGRSCIIASSKEAKHRGVKTAMTVRDAKVLCPEIVLVPAQFELYLSATKRLKLLFDSFAPDVDIFSLDEAFLDYTPLKRLYASPLEFGQKIQAAIKKELGEWVTCNVGIGPNKLLAKMTGEVSPKGSVTEVTEQNRAALLASTCFKDVCGIGFRLERRLQRFGVTTPYQINFLDDEMLLAAFGPFWSVELRKIGQGEEPHFLARPAVKHNGDMKSVGRSLTGFKLWETETAVRQVIYNLSEEVLYKVRAQGLAGREVSVFLVGSWRGQSARASARPVGWGELPDHTPSWGAHQMVPHHIRHTREFYAVIDQMLQSWTDQFPVIKIGVRLSHLEPWESTPKVLWPEWWREEKVAMALDSLTSKYGLFTVRPAALLGHDMIRPEVTGFLGDQKFQLGS